MVGRNWRIALGEGHLHLARAAQCIDDAGELHQQPVIHRLDDPVMAFGDLGIHQLGPNSPEPFQGSALIGSDQPRIAGDIGGEDRGKSAGLAHVGTAGQALVPILIQPMTAPHFFFDRRAGR